MESQIKGWTAYPENVSPQDVCGYTFDAQECRQELEKDAERLFSEHRIDLQVFELGREDFNLNSSSKLDEYLEKSHRSPVSQIFLIPQAHSWAPLSITFDAFRKLCTKFEVFPSFLNVVRTFGQKTTVSNDSYSAFDSLNHEPTNILEMSYLVKHVDKHDRPREDPEDKWSFRQTGLYHRIKKDSSSTMIILNPSKTFFSRLRQLNTGTTRMSPWDIQILLLSCCTRQWKWYQSDLETRVLTAQRRAQLADVRGTLIKASPTSSNEIVFDNVQDLQVLQSSVTTLCLHLDIDKDVLEQVEKSGFGHYQGGRAIRTLIRGVEEQLTRARVTSRRLDDSLALVRTLLGFRCLEISVGCLEKLKHNADSMIHMTEVSQQEMQAMHSLSQKASRDTETLKTITFLGLVYLPASFGSSLMAMGYINVHNLQGKLSLVFEGGFYIFLVITVGLWIITFTTYHVWKSLTQRRMGSY